MENRSKKDNALTAIDINVKPGDDIVAKIKELSDIFAVRVF